MDTSKLRKESGGRKRKNGTSVSRFYDGATLIAKDCSICLEVKPVSEFSEVPTTTSRDGLYSRCKDCTKVEQKMFREKYSKDPTKDTNKYARERSLRTNEEIESQRRKLHPSGTKLCPTCGDTKDLKRFQKNRSTKDGHNYQCSKCANRARRVKGDPKATQARKYPDGTKKCPKCDTDKVLNQFYKNRTTHDGLHRLCRSCDSTHARNKRRQAYESHWKANNIPFECYVCQGPYDHSDHVIPEILGGTDDPRNRLPMCAHHNTSKNGTLLSQWLEDKHHDIMSEVIDRVVSTYQVRIEL